MTDAEIIAILSRWVYELQVDLLMARAELATVNPKTAESNRQRSRAYWASRRLAPGQALEASSELDPAAA